MKNFKVTIHTDSLHGGAPWIRAERFVSKEEEK